jgi:hypothetical protein
MPGVRLLSALSVVVRKGIKVMRRRISVLPATILILILGSVAIMPHASNRSQQIDRLRLPPIKQAEASSLVRSVVRAEESPQLYPVLVKGKTGFINNAGKLVIPAQFDPGIFWIGGSDGKAATFSDGMARIMLKFGNSPTTSYPIYRYGYIDATGKVSIPPQYEEAEDFSEGLAAVKVSTWREGYRTTKDRYGYIDKTGQMVLPAKYYSAGSFSEGLANVCEEEAGCGYIDYKGQMAFKLPDGLTAPSEFHDGLATVLVLATGDYGFIDHAGRLVYEGQFGSYPIFSEGLVLNFPDGKRGLMDKTGQMVVEIKNRSAHYFQEGMALIEQEGKLGFIDLSGQIVVEPQFSGAKGFSEGLAAVEIKGRWGYIDKTGRMVIEPRFDLAGKFNGGIAAVTVGMINADVPQTRIRNGYIDKSGKYVWRPS